MKPVSGFVGRGRGGGSRRLVNNIAGIRSDLIKIETPVFSLGAESRKKSSAKHFGYKLATGLHLKKNEF